MTKARNIASLLSTANGKIAGANLDVSFENITDTGTEGTRVATGTSAERGSTAGQLRFNTTTGLAEYYDGLGFKEVDVPPSISTVSSSNIAELDIAGGYDLTINGSNFATGAVVKFIGNNEAVTYTSPTVTRNSSSELVARVNTSVSNANEPFSVQVVNPNGFSVNLTNAFNVDAKPIWQTTSGKLGDTQLETIPINLSTTATDPESDTITYSETGGTVLSNAGLSLSSSTGAITGTIASVPSETTYSFALRATSGTNFTDRNFNIVVRPAYGLNYSKAITVSSNSNVISTVLSTLGATDGNVEEGVYFVNTMGSYTQPVVLRNITYGFSTHTWLCVQKNFAPHVYKGGQAGQGHPTSYGLMDGSNNALSGLNSNMGSTGSTYAQATAPFYNLGDYNFRVYPNALGSGTSWANYFGVYGRDGVFYYNNYGTGTIGQLDYAMANNNSFSDSGENTSMLGGSTMYMIWRRRFTSGDQDCVNLSLWDNVTDSQDLHFDVSQGNGGNWARDGSGYDYTTLNKDSGLGNANNYGKFSIWIR